MRPGSDVVPVAAAQGLTCSAACAFETLGQIGFAAGGACGGLAALGLLALVGLRPRRRRATAG